MSPNNTVKDIGPDLQCEIDDAPCHMEGRWGLGGDSSSRLAFSGTSPSILQCIYQQNARHRTVPSFELGKVYSQEEATFPKTKKKMHYYIPKEFSATSGWHNVQLYSHIPHGGHLLLEIFYYRYCYL